MMICLGLNESMIVNYRENIMYVVTITLTSILSQPTLKLWQAGHQGRGRDVVKYTLSNFPSTGGRELKRGGYKYDFTN